MRGRVKKERRGLRVYRRDVINAEKGMRKTRDLFGKLKAQRKSVADVGHQRHETRAFDGGGDSVLADGRATGLAAANDFALATGQFF